MGRSRFSALKRALAYKSLFSAHSEWSPEFMDCNPPRETQHALTSRVRKAIGRRLWSYDRTGSHQEEILDRARECDLVYFLKTPTADLQNRVIALNRPRVVVDVNDALWLSHHGNGFCRLTEMLTTAHGVICENDYVAHYVRKYNPCIRIVPDCTQLDAFDSLRGSVSRNESKVRLGWIGSNSTAGFLYRIWEPLEDLFTRHPNLELRIVGADPEHLPPFEKVRWSSVLEYDREQMVREALSMHIGLFPLFRVEDSLARGNGKAVIYMAAAAAAVCSNIGEHTRLIKDNVNGFLAHDSQEWIKKLEFLVMNPEERVRVSKAGLETVRAELSDRHCFERLNDALSFFLLNGR